MGFWKRKKKVVEKQQEPVRNLMLESALPPISLMDDILSSFDTLMDQHEPEPNKPELEPKKAALEESSWKLYDIDSLDSTPLKATTLKSFALPLDNSLPKFLQDEDSKPPGKPLPVAEAQYQPEKPIVKTSIFKKFNRRSRSLPRNNENVFKKKEADERNDSAYSVSLSTKSRSSLESKVAKSDYESRGRPQNITSKSSQSKSTSMPSSSNWNKRQNFRNVSLSRPKIKKTEEPSSYSDSETSSSSDEDTPLGLVLLKEKEKLKKSSLMKEHALRQQTYPPSFVQPVPLLNSPASLLFSPPHPPHIQQPINPEFHLNYSPQHWVDYYHQQLHLLQQQQQQQQQQPQQQIQQQAQSAYSSSAAVVDMKKKKKKKKKAQEESEIV